ncbi:hypothetical protein [Caldalkalibacillus salinus]|uniref:hypothetical protein n=1 Tax=Caldalkalibacillus salinus TaxID=2803787 RepID=UPI0019240DA2|nr:hypothetical protein [Caldalkalibacillus salinus]
MLRRRQPWMLTLFICLTLTGLFTYLMDGDTRLIYANESQTDKPDAELNQSAIVETVKSYSDQLHPDDQLVEIEENIQVKASHLEGVVIDGETYYYHISPHMSYDPVATGEVSVEDVEVIHDEEYDDSLFVIYTIPNDLTR